MRPVACSASASNSPTVTLSCRLASSVRFACRKTRGKCFQGQASSNISKGHPPSSIPIDLQIENCCMAACLLTLCHNGRTIQRWVVRVPWRTDVVDVGLLRKGKPDEYLRISHLYTETRDSSASREEFWRSAAGACQSLSPGGLLAHGDRAPEPDHSCLGIRESPASFRRACTGGAGAWLASQNPRFHPHHGVGNLDSGPLFSSPGWRQEAGQHLRDAYLHVSAGRHAESTRCLGKIAAGALHALADCRVYV